MSDAPILSALNLVQNLDEATDFERKHTPYVSLESAGDLTKVSVAVGHYVGHPNQPDHYIQWIDIQVNGNSIARFDLAPVAAEPVVSVCVRLEPGTTVRAIEYCNLHGVWAAEAVI